MRSWLPGAAWLPLCALLVACVGDVGEGKVEATVQDPPANEAATGAQAGTRLAVDVKQSKVSALGAKITATHPIDFHEWSGAVSLDGDKLTGVEFEVSVASLESDHPRLTDHLKAEDFLHVEKFPKATFKSSAITAASGEGATHSVTGDLTIRGKTKRLTFPATIEIGEDAVRARTEFTINRQDFEVRYPGKPDDLVQDNVVLTINLVAPRG